MYIGNLQFIFYYINTRTRAHVHVRVKKKIDNFCKPGMYIGREYDMITLKNRKQGDLII